MNDYFPMEQSMEYYMGGEIKPVLRGIANRYVSDNPPVPVVYYLRSRNNFSVSRDYMDQIYFHEKFPDMAPETYAYAWACLTPPQSGPFHFRFRALGPVRIYVNGEPAFRTSHVQERFPDQTSDICLDLREGVNSLFFECISTPLGCGFAIGSSSYKGRRIQFFGPSRQRRGDSGFLYSGPLKNRILSVPELFADEEATGIMWYPEVQWKESEAGLPPSERIFGRGRMSEEGQRILSVTSVDCPRTGLYEISVEGREEALFCVDGKREGIVRSGSKRSLRLAGGRHTLAFLGGDVEVTVTSREGESIPLACPVRLAGGQPLVWLYAGPFEADRIPPIKEALTFQKPILTAEGLSFWRVDLPEVMIRPFNEGALYGEWNYPLGVTLSGLIQCARLLGDGSLADYVEGHMRKCVDFFRYCVWDQETYGAAPFHNQLTTMDSLDDCGSFASALLEVMRDREIPEGDWIADVVASFLEEGQQRLEDGTFYRNHSYLPVMNETIWADDMYMSIPFLSRYYESKGDERRLEEGIRQVKNFYRYLYMPELQIMSHIYDTRYQVQTQVPWGRGNGWALFSIAELLTVMPKGHEERENILSIYRSLCQGYLRLQGEDGMWRQVLTFPDSYRETSCTAMFVYGFARGIRYGWLTDPEYEKAAIRGFQGLCSMAVDWKGNIYGVCRGSGYSFSKEYYARDLGWNFNDTHGIGIVLLAGIEVEKMKEREEA